MENNKKPAQQEHRPHRPVGFSPAKTSAMKLKAEASKADPNESKKKRFWTDLFRRKKPKKKTRPKPKRIKKPKKKSTGSGKKSHGLFIVIAVIIVIALIAAAAVFTGNQKVHQMPTILRITEEPTQAPEETVST